MKYDASDLRVQWALKFFKANSRGVVKPLNKKEMREAGLLEKHLEIAKKVIGYDS